MVNTIGEGYTTITTNASLGFETDPTNWELTSPGNPNLYLLQNLGSVSLHDEAVIAKSLIQSYYNSDPAYSYWSGCSQGGRQGLILAQRYPDLYNNIVALTLLIIDLIGKFLYSCELDALRTAAISACDGLDGVVDGLIFDMDVCFYDLFTAVDTVIKNCSQTGTNIKTSARTINGSFSWYSKSYGVDLSGDLITKGDTAIVCSGNGICIGDASVINPSFAVDWIKYFVKRDADFNMENITHKEFDNIFYVSFQRFNNIIGTTDLDLTAFKAAGGKMLVYHGLTDQIIPPKGTEDYYNTVTEVIPDVHDFYCFYKVPGLQHCSSGNGGQPTTIFDAMVSWVENGTVPEILPISFKNTNGTTVNRKLCSHPLQAKYDGSGDSNSADSFVCA